MTPYDTVTTATGDDETRDTVRIDWTVPPFKVIFGIVWRTGAAIVVCYGLLFVVGAMLAGALLGA